MKSINDIELLSNSNIECHWPFITKFISKYNSGDVSFALILKNLYIFKHMSNDELKNSIIKLFDIDYALFKFHKMYNGEPCIEIFTDSEVAREGFNLIKSIFAPWSDEYKEIENVLKKMDNLFTGPEYINMN